MTPEQFQAAYPLLISWIQITNQQHVNQAHAVSSLGFPRLPLYFTEDLLISAKAVVVTQIPKPSLSAMGLTQFTEFENLPAQGITYLDTFYVLQQVATDESLYCHELIHVLQWRFLGPERFIALYADGLEKYGYRNSPLEVMAFNAQAAFAQSRDAFDAGLIVRNGLQAIWPEVPLK